jgi:oligogalacturonide lyase
VLTPSARAQDVVTQPKPGAPEPPREWIDKDTGHRVIRLSDKPGSGSLYFNFNGYTPDGRPWPSARPTASRAWT